MSSKASGSQNRKRIKRWTKENETCGNALRSFLLNNNVPPEFNMNGNPTAESDSDSDNEPLINYHDQDASDHVMHDTILSDEEGNLRVQGPEEGVTNVDSEEDNGSSESDVPGHEVPGHEVPSDIDDPPPAPLISVDPGLWPATLNRNEMDSLVLRGPIQVPDINFQSNV